MKKSILKRTLGYLISFMMLISLVPASVMADGEMAFLSPSEGVFLELGEPVVLKVSAPGASSVAFTVNGEAFDGEIANDADTFAAAYVPSVAGKVDFVAAADNGTEVSASCIVLEESTEVYTWDFSEGTATSPLNPGDSTNVWAGLSGGSLIEDSSSDRGNYGKIATTKGTSNYVSYHNWTPAGNGYIFECDLMLSAVEGQHPIGLYLGGNTMDASLGNGNIWIPASSKTVTGIYNANEWFNIKVFVDFASSTVTYFIDDAVVAAGVPFRNTAMTASTAAATLKYPYTIYDASFATYIDNICVRNAFIPEPATVAHKLPAAGTILEKGQSVALQADVTGEAVKVEFFADGTSIGEGIANADNTVYTLSWSPEYTGDVAVTSKVTDKFGNTSVSEAVMMKVLPTTVKGTWDFNDQSISGGDGVSLNQGTNEYAVITESYGNSLKLWKTRNQGLYLNFNPAPSTNIIVYEFDYYFTANNDANNSLLLATRDSSSSKPEEIQFRAGNISLPYAPWTKIGTYEIGKWHRFKFVFNNETMTKDVYMDGVQLINNEPVKAAAPNGSFVLLYPWTVDQVSFTYVDNVSARIISTPFEAKASSVNGADGALEVYRAADITDITVTFSKAVSTALVNAENIKLYRGSDDSAPVDIVPELAEDGVTVKVPVALEEAAAYRLVIDGKLASSDGTALGESYEVKFNTIAENKGADNGKFKTATGYIESLNSLTEGTTVTFEADVVSPDSENVWLVIALYSDNAGTRQLKQINIKKFELTSALKESHSVSLTLEADASAGDVLGGFVWDNSTYPFCDGFDIACTE